MTHGRPLKEDPDFADKDYRTIGGEGPTWLADLTGQAADLERTFDACKRVLGLLAGRPVDVDLVEMLWHFAITSYGRCFSTGVRFSANSAVISLLDDEQAAQHDRFMDMRNKFVAHSVNGHEHDIPVVDLAPRDSERPGLKHLGVISMRTTPPLTAEPVMEFMKHTATVRGIYQRSIEALKTQLEEGIRTEPLDRLYTLPVLSFSASKTDTSGRPREHPRRGKS